MDDYYKSSSHSTRATLLLNLVEIKIWENLMIDCSLVFDDEIKKLYLKFENKNIILKEIMK